jgi:cell wall-associated NlpC family hydrolase
MSLSIFVDNKRLTEFLKQIMDGHVHYAQHPRVELSTRPEAVHVIDCSGFVRYVLFRVCDIALAQDGSWHLNEWCKSYLQSEAEYKCASQMDGIIRVGYFAHPKGKPKHDGHIWLILNGWTMESHGGHGRHGGPHRRRWNTKVLTHNVEHSYVLGPTGNVYPDGVIPPSGYAYA